jgi:hypothetical protein
MSCERSVAATVASTARGHVVPGRLEVSGWFTQLRKASPSDRCQLG